MDFTNISNMFLMNESPGTLGNGIDPVAFHIGGLDVRYYGIFAFIGFTVAIALIIIKLHFWYKVPLDPFIYFAFLAIPTSILGARIWSFIIGDAQFYPGANFSERIVQFFSGRIPDGDHGKSGGLAIQGGVMLTTITGLIYFPLVLRKPKYQIRTMKDGIETVKPVSTFVYADVIIPCILVGQLIGRWGNFFNGELFGSAVRDGSLDWLSKVMPGVYDGMYDSNTNAYYQPLFLYESFCDFWLFLFLYVAIEFIPNIKAGDISAGYFIGYGIIRLIMEPLRDAQFRFISTYVICGLQIVFGIAFILYNHLWFCKHRDIKYFYTFWVKFSYRFKLLWALMNKSYRFKLEQRDPEAINYGYAKKPEFNRKPTEIFYYRGH